MELIGSRHWLCKRQVNRVWL